MLRTTTALLTFFLVLLCARLAAATGSRVPLRIDAPDGAPAGVAVPVTGGIPFPQGVLETAEHMRLLAGGKEVPAQVTRTAVWPDGSVKWVRVDAALPPSKAGKLELEFGPDVRRAKVPGGLRTTRGESGVRVTGPGLAAVVGRRSGGLDLLTVEGKKIFSSGKKARLVLESLRVSGPAAFDGPDIVCSDPDAKAAVGEVVVTEQTIEIEGPVRVRVLVRGHLRVPGWGTGLPERVLSLEPPERVPFTLRFDFVRGVPVVLVENRIVYTGEPDRDFITRWELALPGQGAGSSRLVLEPGLTEDRGPGGTDVVTGLQGRICRAGIRDGFVLIRSGWENRPCLVGGEGKDARISFWPPEAGPMDLRRFAREWSTGESGNRDRPEDMERYARYAARGLAKSHAAVLWFGGEDDLDGLARAFAGPALLVAPPAWYAASGVFGAYVPEDRDGRFAPLEAGVRRYLDWFRLNQDLYRWHGKLEYGFWQTRNGDIHRHDRWDRDYGRWGWSLGDGAGRVGHVLMLTYLRTLDRRYFTAGEAHARAVFDTSMVHTLTHLENARASWWKVVGCNHRHNVQPFGCPYIGMRGSYPYGNRILWFLAGDGVVRDGLDIVAASALDYATNRPGAFGASGGPDGRGSGALALLFAYETSGDHRYLDACGRILRRGDVIPGKPGSPLSYAAAFGLFLAAEEYLALAEDEEFAIRFRALADRALAEKNRTPFLTVLAWAARTTGEEKYRTAVEELVGVIDFTGSLAELPVERWPGHGGPRRPPSRANVARDLPYAYAALVATDRKHTWPEPVPDPARIPAEGPEDWFRPAGRSEKRDRTPDAARLLGRGGRQPDEFEGFLVTGRTDSAGNRFREKEEHAVKVSVVEVKVDGRRAKRVAVAVRPPKKSVVAGFGFRVPLPLGDDPKRIQVTCAGRFRLERWSIDQNGERIPGWLNSDSRTRWPLWRGGGIVLGPAGSYRIFKQSAGDTAPVWVDRGSGSPGWLDITDRGGEKSWGVTVRPLRDIRDGRTICIRLDLEGEQLRVELHSPVGDPLRAAEGPFAGAADVIRHDGWRPPLGPPDLTREQYATFLDDLDYGGNIGLFALRFLLAEDHRVPPGNWKERLADTGIEPRELLLSMQWKGGLARHCERIGVRFDPDRPDETVRRVVEHYRKR